MNVNDIGSDLSPIDARSVRASWPRMTRIEILIAIALTLTMVSVAYTVAELSTLLAP